MKRKDLALIAVVIVVSTIFSLVVSQYFIASPKNRQQEVEVVQPISADFKTPDKKFFNGESFDPTLLISINQNQNPNPFGGSKSQ